MSHAKGKDHLLGRGNTPCFGSCWDDLVKPHQKAREREESIKVMRSLFPKRFRLGFLMIGTLFLLWVGLKNAFAQPVSSDQKGSPIQMGEVTFRLREIDSKPESLTFLELHVPVLNRSRKEVIPANTITVIATVGEVVALEGKALSRDDFGTVEGTLNAPLPPGTGRIVVLGLPLPREKVASITFEIQIDPPHGDSRKVTWPGR